MKKATKWIICGIIVILLLMAGYFAFQNLSQTKYDDNEVKDTSSLKQYIEEIEDKEIKDGESITYYENGNIKEKGEYKNGYPIGEWNTYYENGQLKSTSNYIRNEEHGMTVNVGKNINYSEDGTIESILTTEDDGTLVSREIFNASGTKTSELNAWGMFYYNEDGTISGVIGKNGDEDEWYTGYYDYEKGIKYIEGKMVNGEREGEWTRYYENGDIESIVNYVDGVEEGEYVEYYENGNVIIKGNKIKGEYDGNQYLYYENGTLKSIINSKDGEIIDMIRYNQDGTVMTEDEYNKYMESLD